MKKSRGFGKSATSSKAVASAIGLVALTLLLIPYIYQYENVIKLIAVGNARSEEGMPVVQELSKMKPDSFWNQCAAYTPECESEQVIFVALWQG